MAIANSTGLPVTELPSCTAMTIWWWFTSRQAGWLHRTGLDAGETRFVVQTLRDQLGQRVFPVHRLNKGTSGVLVMALSSEAARGLVQAARSQQILSGYGQGAGLERFGR